MLLTASLAAPGAEAWSRCQALVERPERCGHVNDDDEGAARIFRALCDPTALRLLLHVLEVEHGDVDVEHALDMTGGSAAVHLDHLVGAGLMVRTQGGDGSGVYRATDPATIEQLLATVRQLGTRNLEA